MRKIIPLIFWLGALGACQKQEAGLLVKYQKLAKTEDPVLAYYAPLGNIIRVEVEDYQSEDTLCGGPSGLYFFSPDFGPYQGKQVRIYRFPSRAAISGPCDDTFVFKKVLKEAGNIKYLTCPEDGDNCKEVEMPWGCALVFCDDENS